jgi:hypothetical protein
MSTTLTQFALCSTQALAILVSPPAVFAVTLSAIALAVVMSCVCEVIGVAFRTVRSISVDDSAPTTNHRQSPADIFEMRDWLQMVGINAAANTAKMIQEKAGGNRPAQFLIRYTVDHEADTVLLDLSVTAAYSGASPEPTAGIRLRDDVLQEPLKYCRISPGHLISFQDRLLRLRADWRPCGAISIIAGYVCL